MALETNIAGLYPAVLTAESADLLAISDGGLRFTAQTPEPSIVRARYCHSLVVPVPDLRAFLVAERERTGVTYTDIAANTGISIDTLRAISVGRLAPNLELLDTAARFLGWRGLYLAFLDSGETSAAVNAQISCPGDYRNINGPLLREQRKLQGLSPDELAERTAIPSGRLLTGNAVREAEKEGALSLLKTSRYFAGLGIGVVVCAVKRPPQPVNAA